MSRASTDRRRRRGFATLDVLIAIGIVAYAMPKIISYGTRLSEASTDTIARSQLAQFRQATTEFSRSQYSALLAEAVAGGGSTARTAAELRAAGALPATFPDTNPFGQVYRAIYRVDTPGRLDWWAAAVGGAPPVEDRVAGIAEAFGADGGYVSRKTPTRLRGVGNTFDIPVASVTVGGVGLPAGSIAVASYYSSSSVLTNYLYRYDIGIPEANTMHAAINMNGQRITDALDVGLSSTASTGRTLAQSIGTVVIGPDGTVVPKPTCPAGLAPVISTAVMNAARSASGEVLSGIETVPEEAGPNWILRMTVSTPLGQAAPAAPYGLVEAKIRCEVP